MLPAAALIPEAIGEVAADWSHAPAPNPSSTTCACRPSPG